MIKDDHMTVVPSAHEGFLTHSDDLCAHADEE